MDNFRFLTYESLKRIIDNAYDEIFVYDRNFKAVYVNKACQRHYDLSQGEIIGSTFDDLLSDERWYPSVLPNVYREKKQMTIEQTSFMGEKLITTAVPLFDDQGEIEYVVMSVYDSTCDISNKRSEIENLAKSKSKQKKAKLEEQEENIVFHTASNQMKAVIEFADHISKFDSTLLIHGESGTGKNYLAKYIHSRSLRSDKPFISLNCAAIPEQLLESELFGYASGAFTGASKGGKVGLIELAEGGTILLDEIGELSLTVQAKILHVIQDKKFIPVGGNELKSADVRIIAATNKDLMKLVAEKTFREDLFWRLNVVEIEILPLRERKDDISFLSDIFLEKFNLKHGCKKIISDECEKFFSEYPWPGNIRQLENLIERMVITSEGESIMVSDLPKLMFRDDYCKIEKKTMDVEYNTDYSLDYAVEQYERKIVIELYKEYPSTRKLAEALKISQTKAAKLIRKYC